MSRLGDHIAAVFGALNDERSSLDDCPSCAGDGWYVGHEDECYDSGDCVCSGVQIQCDECGGTGKNAA